MSRLFRLLVLLLLLLCAVAGCADAPFASERPYLQNVSTTGATILYHAPKPASVVVAVEGPGGKRAAWSSPREGTAHEARIEGLEPGTRYTYRTTVLGGEARSFEAELVTAPAAGDPRPVRFAVLGDSGKTTGHDPFKSEGRQGAIAERILERRPDLVLHTGDVVYDDGAWHEYSEGYFKPFAALGERVPVYPSLGNHDLHTEAGGPYYAAFAPPASQEGGERYYSFDWGDIHFVAVDNSKQNLHDDPRQLDWLERDLAATKRRVKVVFGHAPLFGYSTRDEETVKARTADPGGPLGAAARPVIQPILARHGVNFYFGGHVHVYERLDPVDGVLHVTTGGGGKSLYFARTGPLTAAVAARYHFVLVTVDARRGKITLEAIDDEGETFDRVDIPLPP